MKKNVVILGSTGSIGSETIKLFKNDKKNFSIKLLSTNKNISKVYKQAIYFNVKNVIIKDYLSYVKAKKKFKQSNIKFHNSFSIIDKIFDKKKIFYTMISIVGLDGLDPTLRMIKYTNNIAIINKESLICAWNIISKYLTQYKCNFYPIDSEHFSIFSLLNGKFQNRIDKVFITASGGPFLNFSNTKLSKVTLEQSLNHPNWSMGKKISIDSSTMMNKLFEVIEAKKIFNLSYNKIKILIHPKSYVHGMVKFKNGLTKLLIHDPRMIIPIHNSIYFNENKDLKSNKIDFKALNNLNFQNVDYKKFPLLKLLNKLPEKDSLFETVLVTINDYFVLAFLKKKINFIKLIDLIKFYSNSNVFNKFKRITPKNLHDIYKTRKFVNEILHNSGI